MCIRFVHVIACRAETGVDSTCIPYQVQLTTDPTMSTPIQPPGGNRVHIILGDQGLGASMAVPRRPVLVTPVQQENVPPNATHVIDKVLLKSSVERGKKPQGIYFSKH